MYNDTYNDIYNEKDTLTFILNYFKENFIGILLLLLAIFIIYVVDCISQINLSIFTTPIPIPFQGPILSTANNTNLSKILSKKKRKH
jgi:uncharacterized lipoprotein YajG